MGDDIHSESYLFSCYQPIRWNRLSSHAERDNPAHNRGVGITVPSDPNDVCQCFRITIQMVRRNPETERDCVRRGDQVSAAQSFCNLLCIHVRWYLAGEEDF